MTPKTMIALCADGSVQNDVLKRLPDFVSAIQTATNEHFAANLKSLVPDVISYTIGPKYVRIVKTDGVSPDRTAWEVGNQSRSVWGFVNLTNGDILKAAGWKAPAKHARGNIFAPDFDRKRWSSYGPAYL